MNEKGFATILSLCLMLILAMCATEIREAENNHAYETIDFQIESDLQNAAEIGLYMAMEKVKEDPTILLFNRSYIPSEISRQDYQKKIIDNENVGSSKVTVWGERILIQPYKVNYALVTNGKYVAKKNGSEILAYILISRAEPDITHLSEKTNEKTYRSARGYVEFDNDGSSDTKIHFMVPVTSNDYIYK